MKNSIYPGDFLGRDMSIALFSITFLLLLSVSEVTRGEDRALLVGVGAYRATCAGGNRCNDLPGVDVDLETMSTVASYLGYHPSQVKVLHNEQATYANVKVAFDEWLGQGVEPGDKVLLYFTGHGTHVPDEDGDEGPGNADAALVLHDAEAVRRKGKTTMRNVLVDDELGKWLRAIPSREVLVLVDACHSGDVYRSVGLRNQSVGEVQGVVKYFSYPGAPRGRAMLSFKSAGAGKDVNFTALSAARDDEKALTTAKGSFFTLGVGDAISQAAQTKTSLTPRELRDAAEAYLRTKVDAQQLYHPQLAGSPGLADKPLPVAGQQGGHGPKWVEVEAWTEYGARLTVHAAKNTYRVGEYTEFVVEVPAAGYLNLISVGPDDAATVLFPNFYQRDNLVQPGTLRVPGDASASFRLPAMVPRGPSLVVAIWSEKDKPLNLYEDSIEARDDQGRLTKKKVLGSLSAKGRIMAKSRSIGVSQGGGAEEKGFATGKIVVQVE